MAGSSQVNAGRNRLAGLDIARFLAFFGMVLVNFKVVTGAEKEGASAFLYGLHTALEGRAAALFVLLAGVGIGLGARKVETGTLRPFQMTIVRRGLVLFAFGMLNVAIFEADILHFYGLYFLCAALLLPLNTGRLLTLASLLVLSFPLMAVLVNYDTGWNWDTLAYADFWTVTGFLHHSFLNGWHPVLPWLAFLLVGIAVARQDLRSTKVRAKILIAGLAMFVTALLLSIAFDQTEQVLAISDPEWIETKPVLVSLFPIPPAPLYMLSATGSALVLLVLALWLGDWIGHRTVLSPIIATGRQALTLYIGHIIVGMGVLEMFGWVKTEAYNPDVSLSEATWAALCFTLAAIIYATIWKRYFGQGPLERLLRKLAP